MKLKKLNCYKFLLFTYLFTFITFSAQKVIACNDIKFFKTIIYVLKKNSNQKLKLNIEVADTDLKRKIGLQCRKVLKKDEGMLFRWKSEDYRIFWMKETSIPLDIIFIDKNYQIIDVFYNAKPFDLSPISSEFKAKYVLELNAGVFDSNNLRLSDEIIIKK